MRSLLLALVALQLFVTALIRAEDFSSTFAIAPAPGWVLPEGDIPVPTHGAEEGARYLLSDYQENVSTGELFVHIVKELRTPAGVQDGSTIAVDYDPSYQTLLFHQIHVIRGGVSSSRLSRGAVSLLQRETDLESSMLDGSVTASFVLKDTRPGDRIDYSYTVRGTNPVLGKLFADSFPYGWDFALGRQRIRILSPSSRTLKYRAIGSSAEPHVSRTGALTEYLWEFRDPAPILGEDATPSWYVMYPWIEISEFPDWAAVDRWALSLFPPAPLPRELETLVAQWKKLASPEDRLQAALDYVQQEVRYVGIELGAGSYRPRSPRTVCEQRFGDCKDKAYLLVTLLSRLGIEAFPVLVNSSSRRLLADRLPSPYDFNHVIVAVSLKGRRIYVDPTDAWQRGPVLERYVSDFGYGLIVAPGQKDLVRFGSYQGRPPEMEIVDTFTSAGQTEPAALEVRTTAYGREADDLREEFAAHTTEEIAKNYLNFYAADYSKIESAGTIEVHDDPARNIFTTVERYRIPGFWSLLPDGRNYRSSFFPSYIYNVIPVPKTKIRSSPIGVPYPKIVNERIEVRLADLWPGKDEAATITTAAFELKTHFSSQGATVVLDYRYRSLANAVPVRDVPAYNEKVKDIDQNLGYRLTWQAAGARGKGGPPDGSVMVILVLAALLLAVGGFGGYRLAIRQPTPAPAVTLTLGGGPTGLGGWLVLVAIGLFARPLLTAMVLNENWQFFTIGNWFDMTNPAGARFNSLWAPYLLFLVISSMAIAAASVVLIIMFFQRRRKFPFLFIGLLVLEAATVIANVVFTRTLSGKTDQSVGADLPRAVMQAVAGCAIWIPYMLSSRRVKNTFDR